MQDVYVRNWYFEARKYLEAFSSKAGGKARERWEKVLEEEGRGEAHNSAGEGGASSSVPVSPPPGLAAESAPRGSRF